MSQQRFPVDHKIPPVLRSFQIPREEEILLTRHAVERCASRFLGISIEISAIQPGSEIWERCSRSIRRLYRDAKLRFQSSCNSDVSFHILRTRCLVLSSCTVLTVYRSDEDTGFSKQWIRRKTCSPPVKRTGINLLFQSA